MIASFAREIRQLIWYFQDREGELKSDLQSVQPRWEAEREAREQMQRHRSFWTRDGRGTLCLPGTDTRCGCTVHQTGDPGGRKDAPAINHLAVVAVREEAPIAQALLRADESAPHLRDPPWTCVAPPSHVLRLRFREPLGAARAMFEGAAAARVHATRKLAESTSPRDRQRAAFAADAARAQPETGAGNLAHLTTAAVEAFAAARTERELPRWVDALGRKLGQPRAEPQERALGRVITLQCEVLELQALLAYRKAFGRVPERVRRAGLARAG